MISSQQSPIMYIDDSLVAKNMVKAQTPVWFGRDTILSRVTPTDEKRERSSMKSREQTVRLMRSPWLKVSVWNSPAPGTDLSQRSAACRGPAQRRGSCGTYILMGFRTSQLQECSVGWIRVFMVPGKMFYYFICNYKFAIHVFQSSWWVATHI